MLSVILIALLALLVFAYLAAPLLFADISDPLPDHRDPITQELEEERDALFRAIQELDSRSDLAQDRREQLRARYEAKAAKVLRALDERQSKEREAPAAPQTGRRPWPIPSYATLTLLGIMIASGSMLGGYVLPRVGQDATITTFDEQRLAAGRALQELQREADRNPDAGNLLALADAYWQLGDAEQAEAVYERITTEIDSPPAIAYRRLGFLNLQSDLGVAVDYLEQAREIAPGDLDTLYALGEVYFALNRPEEAVSAWEQYLELDSDPEVSARLELVNETMPLARAVQEDPSQENLLALADAYWQVGEEERAVNAYFEILTEHDPGQPQALSRVGQLLFISGRTDDAAELLLRARIADPSDLETLLFLGNARFSQGNYAEAIDAWEDYVEVAGGSDQAGRVPDLISDAQARLTGAPADEVEHDLVEGAEVYAANCAACHGVAGQGGSGPRLAGNPRSTDEAFVRRVVEHGSGMMPAFGRTLPSEQLDAVIEYVTGTLAPGGEVRGR